MICTETLIIIKCLVNYEERNKRPCSLKVACLFHRTSCSNFFEKYCVKCTKALAAIPFFHGECVNLTVSQKFDNFYLGFVSRTFTIHRTAGEGGCYVFYYSVPLLLALYALKHKPGNCSRELASPHS